ncbi:MAG: hypothetical protein WCH74_02155 [Chloroflexota bacterium]
MTIAQRRITLVWIDADGASIVRWPQSQDVERLESEVPAHRRSTGHVRHEPAAGHGGVAPQDAGERHRNEHLRRFIATVADTVEADDELAVIGPGTVFESLARLIADRDRTHARSRVIHVETSKPLTDRQLVARARELAGAPPRRRAVGVAGT